MRLSVNNLLPPRLICVLPRTGLGDRLLGKRNLSHQIDQQAPLETISALARFISSGSRASKACATGATLKGNPKMSKSTRRSPKAPEQLACLHRFYLLDDDYILNTAVGLYYLKYVVLSRNIFKAQEIVSKTVCREAVGGISPLHILTFEQMIEEGIMSLPRFKIMLGQTVNLRNLGEVNEAFCKPEYTKKVRQNEGYPQVVFLIDDREVRFLKREYGKERLWTLLNDLRVFKNAS